MIPRLIEIVERFPGRRGLVVGDWMLDRYVYGDAERVSPEAPVPVLRVVHREHRAGGSGSVAANLIALGLEVSCFGVVGEDDRGGQLMAALAETGADTSGLVRVSDRPTTTKTRVVGLAQHRHRQQLLRIDEESTKALDRATEDALVGRLERKIGGCDVVCLQDYGKGVVSERVACRVIALARKAGKVVLVDPALLKSYDKYRGATLITPNRNEFRTAAGRAEMEREEIGRLAVDMAGSLELDAMVVTLDSEGSMLARPGAEPVHVGTKVRSVYDNTGAGDAVLAMLAAALAGGGDFVEAVRLANVAGGLEVEKFGCVPIERGEVIADLRLEQRSLSGKLRSVEQLVAELNLLRDRGQTIVFTNGCFDLLHPGHLDFFARCQELGSVVVVGLNSDSSVRAQNKSGNRPFVNEQDRARMLAGLADVDYVVIFDEVEPESLIRKVRPDVLVKGQDWAGRGVVGREFVESYGGRVALLPLLEGYSTTGMAERIRGKGRRDIGTEGLRDRGIKRPRDRGAAG